jgi:hypothetical protein
MYLGDEAIKATIDSMRSVAAPGSFLMCELFSAYLLSEEGRKDPLLQPYWKLVTRYGDAMRDNALHLTVRGRQWR